MFGEQYFRDRFLGIYDFSTIEYINGTGCLSTNVFDIPIQWEMIVLITGEHFLTLHHNDFENSLIQGDSYLNLEGKSFCETWNITSSLQVFSTSINKDEITGAILYSMHCMAKEIILSKNNLNICDIDYIEGLILNFEFLGTEVSKYGSKQLLDHFNIKLYDRDIVFIMNQKSNEIIKLIKEKRIDRALLSSMKIPIIKGDTFEDLDKYMSSLSWFLSFLNLNASMCHIEKYWNGKNLCRILYKNKISSPFHRNVIINNRDIKNGLVQIISNCYCEYLELDSRINMQVFICNLLGMYEGKFLENKIAGLILAYEYLLTKYLISEGEEAEKVSELSIQGKLKKLNKYLKFIPNELLGDMIRTKIRNPLFHMGELSILSKEDRRLFYFKYLDLLIQIILIMLGYKGDYISPSGYYIKKCPDNHSKKKVQ